jgi:lipopolysaccharide export system permease protein
MLTTLDRYFFRRFVYVYAVFLVSLYGLFVVLDLFTNIDEFAKVSAVPGESSGLFDPVIHIVSYYMIRFTEFFEMAGPIMSIVAVIVVLAMIHKNSEIQPILAAGIPTYRMAVPFLLGMGVVNVALILNQEFMIPALAQKLQTPRGSAQETGQSVEPLYDYDRDGTAVLHIDGDRIHLSSRKMTNASFTVRAPKLAHRMITIKATEAIFYPPTAKRPQSGWLLKDINQSGDFQKELFENLTESGQKTIHQQQDSPDLFVVSNVSFDQLYNRTRNHAMISSVQLARRIRRPAAGTASLRGQKLHLHFRFTRPLLAFAMVLGCVPLVLRRESRSLIGNMALCFVTMGAMYLVGQVCLYLGGTSLLATDLAAWLPVILCGGAAAFMSSGVQT